MTLAELQLDGLTIVLREYAEAINLVFLDVGVINDFLAAREGMAISGPIWIIFLLHKAHLYRVLETLGDVAFYASIHSLIPCRAINKLLFRQFHRDVELPTE
jgi:hypothetical protein